MSCPKGHVLRWTACDHTHLGCDRLGCGAPIRRGELHPSCLECDYDECPRCAQGDGGRRRAASGIPGFEPYSSSSEDDDRGEEELVEEFGEFIGPQSRLRVPQPDPCAPLPARSQWRRYERSRMSSNGSGRSSIPAPMPGARLLAASRRLRAPPHRAKSLRQQGKRPRRAAGPRVANRARAARRGASRPRGPVNGRVSGRGRGRNPQRASAVASRRLPAKRSLIWRRPPGRKATRWRPTTAHAAADAPPAGSFHACSQARVVSFWKNAPCGQPQEASLVTTCRPKSPTSGPSAASTADFHRPRKVGKWQRIARTGASAPPGRSTATHDAPPTQRLTATSRRPRRLTATSMEGESVEAS